MPALYFLLALLGARSFALQDNDSSSGESTQATSEVEDDGDDAPFVPPAPPVDENPDPSPAPETPTTPAPVDLVMVIYDMDERRIVEEISEGETVDFGDIDISNYVFAAETADGSPIGSMHLTYQGQTWLQNIYPYTLEESPIDLSEGTFDVSVVAYSDFNAQGDILGERTITFSTTSAPEVVDDTPPPPVDETPPEPVDETPPEPVDETPPEPVDETPPEPVDETPPEPVDETPPEPVDETPPEPVDETPPEPVDETPPEPVDETPPEPVDETPPEVVDVTPDAPDQTGDGGSGASTTPLVASGTVEVMTGRVSTLEPPQEGITGLRIIDGTDHGTVTVNPDGTFALVMTQTSYTGSQNFTYEATYADGSTSTHQVGLNVVPGGQSGGWGTGEKHYILATDANDDIVVEHGDVHTKVYVTAGSHGLSRGEIAAMEGLSTDQITGQWLANSGYGQSEGLALDEQAGMMLWDTVTPEGSRTSNWLLLENGHDYNQLGGLLTRDTGGESELHPLHIGTWGTGDKPVINQEFYTGGTLGVENLVVQGVKFTDGVKIFKYNENIILDDISVTGSEMAVQNSDGITIRNSDFIDVYPTTTENGGSFWEPHVDREQGLYVGKVNGLLLEGLLFDHNGWAPEYSEDASSDSGVPPTMFAHNLYVNFDATDVTLRDTISMRASSFGANFRPGGFVEDNLFLDNNASFVTVGGDYLDSGPVGQYSLITGNVVTSGAHKTTDATIGAHTLGLADDAVMSSLVDNIVAHLADPNNPDELLYKETTNSGVRSADSYYNDTIVYNWLGSAQIYHSHTAEQNTENLDTNVLDQTTIQLFTAQLLGKPDATIDDLANYLRAQADGTFDDVVDADLIIKFFQDGFGLTPDMRPGGTELRFVPDDLGDGVRWDNRMNWDTDDLPGTYSTDDVDLGGNHVVAGVTTEIDEMALSGGALNVYGGRIDANGGITDGGSVNIEGAGQLWIGGHSGDETLDVDVTGGRFVNTGEATETNLTATGGQTVLANGGAIWGVSNGETLSVVGDSIVGFDDEDGGVALLALDQGGTLHFDAENGRLGTIEEFRTGAMGDEPDVRSGASLGDSTLKIDLAGLNAANGEDLMLLDADEIIGVFADADVSGLGGRNATITIDYLNDSVSMVLSNGSGQVNFETVGLETDVDDGEQALWDALTAGQGVFDDTTPPQDIPENEDEYLLAS